VLRLKYRNRTLLLPGDAEKQAEQAMLAENSEEDLHADVLKVGHHGSKNSTTQEFLDAVRPQMAIISAGEDNPYGHPSPELLERLQIAGARVLRTDRHGAVYILTDSDNLEISCFVACDNPASVTVSGSAQAPDQDQNRKQ
jgi:competence protein ComEC